MMMDGLTLNQDDSVALYHGSSGDLYHVVNATAAAAAAGEFVERHARLPHDVAVFLRTREKLVDALAQRLAGGGGGANDGQRRRRLLRRVRVGATTRRQHLCRLDVYSATKRT